MVGSCPSLCCSCREKTCLMQRSRGFGHEVVVSKNYNILIVLLCDCCKLQTKFLASVSSKRVGRGCQPFSCPCSRNATHCRKEIYATCLSKESIPAIPFGYSKHPLLTRSLRFLRVAAPSTNSALCLHHSHPFVAAEEKNQSHAEKQRVWSRSCGLQDLLRPIQ